MSRIVFPSNPTLNQVYTFDGRSWKWNGTKWRVSRAAATQTFSENVTFESNIIIDSRTADVSGLVVKRSNDSNDDALLFWDESSETWKVKDTDPSYTDKKIVVEYDTLDGGNY